MNAVKMAITANYYFPGSSAIRRNALVLCLFEVWTWQQLFIHILAQCNIHTISS